MTAVQAVVLGGLLIGVAVAVTVLIVIRRRQARKRRPTTLSDYRRGLRGLHGSIHPGGMEFTAVAATTPMTTRSEVALSSDSGGDSGCGGGGQEKHSGVGPSPRWRADSVPEASDGAIMALVRRSGQGGDEFGSANLDRGDLHRAQSGCIHLAAEHCLSEANDYGSGRPNSGRRGRPTTARGCLVAAVRAVSYASVIESPYEVLPVELPTARI